MLNIYLFSGKGDVTITIADEDLLKLFQGKLNPQQVNITNDFAYLTSYYLKGKSYGEKVDLYN